MTIRFLCAMRASFAAVAFSTLALGSASALAALPIVATPDSALSTDDRPGVFSVSADGHIHFSQYSGGTWITEDATGLANAVTAPAGANLTSLDGTYLADHYGFFIGSDGHVYHLAKVNNSWSYADLTTSTGAAIANVGSAMASYGSGANNAYVYYFSSAGHLEELHKVNSTWSFTDVNVATNAPVAAAGSAMTAYPYITSYSTSESRIYYFTPNGHVWEMSDTSQGWRANDISAATGAVAARAGSPMSGFAMNGSSKPRVYYFDANMHVRELAWNGGWGATDLTALTGAVAAVAGSDLASLTPGTNLVRIYYNSYDGHVREVGYTGHWGASDPSATVGAAPAVAGSALGATIPPAGSGTSAVQIRVYYLTSDSHIHELSYNSGWHINDLNQ
jgi:hypothetical protein